jgi:hypothetical protein
MVSAVADFTTKSIFSGRSHYYSFVTVGCCDWQLSVYSFPPFVRQMARIKRSANFNESMTCSVRKWNIGVSGRPRLRNVTSDCGVEFHWLWQCQDFKWTELYRSWSLLIRMSFQSVWNSDSDISMRLSHYDSPPPNVRLSSGQASINCKPWRRTAMFYCLPVFLL